MGSQVVWWGRRWCGNGAGGGGGGGGVVLARRRRTVELAHLEVGPELLELVDPLPDEGVVADDDRPALPSRGERERRADSRLTHTHLPSRKGVEDASREVRKVV